MHRVEHFHFVRLEAVLSSPYVFVGPSKIQIAGATALLVKLGGTTGPYLSLVYGLPLAGLPNRPDTSCFVPGEF